jgi:uncharacterized membrane protein
MQINRRSLSLRFPKGSSVSTQEAAMSWDGWFPMLGWILVCVAMIGSCVLFTGRGRARNSALHRLDERFARGELGDDEYKSKREAILSL